MNYYDIGADGSILAEYSGGSTSPIAVVLGAQVVCDVERYSGRTHRYDGTKFVALDAELLPTLTYADLRRTEYPPLTDLADALYWQERGDPSKMVAYLSAVEAVKAAYPKPA